MKNLTETKARGFKVENGKLVYFTNILEGYRHEFKDLQEICKEMNGMMEKHDSYMAQIEFWKCRSDQKNQILERFVKRESDRLRISRKETARKIYRKGKELDEDFDMTGLGEYIIANFLNEENEDEQN